MSVNAIVVVGSLHHDIMIEAERMPATGETLVGQRWYAKFGGKGGNQALAVHQAGTTVRMLGAVGCDGFGDFLLDTLTHHGISTAFIERVDSVGSGMSVAHVDNEGDYGAVIVSGANTRIELSRLQDSLLWQDSSLLLLQNEVPESINLEAAKQARQAGLDVCLNAAPARELSEEFASLVDVLVVNAIEAQTMADVEVHSLADACKAAERLSARFYRVVVTAGGDGAAVARRGNAAIAVAPIQVDVVGTHGAGDLFTGTLCVALADGADLEEAAQLANAAAARHVSA